MILEQLIGGGLIGLLNNAIDKIFPGPEEKARARALLLEAQMKGELAKLEAELQLALAQIETNKIEAGSQSLFRSGWRPSVGWVCSFALLYQMILRPLITWIGPSVGIPSGPPSLELETLMTLLFGMLGLGAYRTYEKVNNVTK